MGTSVGAPDPLQRYRWYILAAFGLLLGVDALYFYFTNRSRVSTVSRKEPDSISNAPSTSSRSDLLLEELKNELFQLEVEHKQGRISEPEYEQARSALDRTLTRAIKRPRK